MVGVFICGPGGAGKTTLVNALVDGIGGDPGGGGVLAGWGKIGEVARRVITERGMTAADFRAPPAHIRLQQLILRAQNEAERRQEEEGEGDYVSDRSALDCLAYAKWRAEQIGGKEGDERWREFKRAMEVEISDSIRRYHRGLVVIVHPWRKGEGGIDAGGDDVRLPMEEHECQQFYRCLIGVLEECKIAYLSLTESDLESRIRKVEEAVSHFKEACSTNMRKQQDMVDHVSRS